MGGTVEAKRKYYQKNREACIKRTRKWREDNHDSYLKDQNERSSLRRETIPEEERKLRARGYALKRKYGITLDQYNDLLDRQNGACAICLKPAEEFSINLAVDHSHKTGEIRGLLCTYCNHRIIGRHTDSDKLRRMANYIENSTGLFIPEKPKKRKKKIAKS